MTRETNTAGRPPGSVPPAQPADTGEVLAGLGSAALVDAMGRTHRHRAHLLPLVSPDPTRTLFGPAVTMAYMPWRDDVPQASRTFADFFYEAVGPDPAGKVLVLSSGGYAQVSHAGGTKLSRAAHHHLAGVLADGRLRDFGQLRGYDFATWCQGETTRWGGDTVMPYAANITVEFAGVAVVPGDYVFCDAAGAVVIPAGSLPEVLETARAVDAEDARFVERIRTEANPATPRRASGT
ncbi:RraA family protein [Streptomyces sp. BH-SS-21]|uniref:Putative 4-hydroxy-4-methyl-2-oxoglutarate aldolase n=1 Tax=Streptomyces liliiviolaceus TaxID=2823109 RepID=A0A941B822_9ACTN|nr:RraA family protein [Streptomyces liliiviolaceus]MBQ0850422.1 RraA family protein [Streptomyces liliiviolaceus]